MRAVAVCLLLVDLDVDSSRSRRSRSSSSRFACLSMKRWRTSVGHVLGGLVEASPADVLVVFARGDGDLIERRVAHGGRCSRSRTRRASGETYERMASSLSERRERATFTKLYERDTRRQSGERSFESKEEVVMAHPVLFGLLGAFVVSPLVMRRRWRHAHGGGGCGAAFGRAAGPIDLGAPDVDRGGQLRPALRPSLAADGSATPKTRARWSRRPPSTSSARSSSISGSASCSTTSSTKAKAERSARAELADALRSSGRSRSSGRLARAPRRQRRPRRRSRASALQLDARAARRNAARGRQRADDVTVGPWGGPRSIRCSAIFATTARCATTRSRATCCGRPRLVRA